MREMSVLGSSVLRARTGKFGVEMMTDALSKLRELERDPDGLLLGGL